MFLTSTDRDLYPKYITSKMGVARIFRRILKNFLRKLRKVHYFIIFFKEFNKPCANFLRVWTKNTTYRKFWENFRKFSTHFLRKLLKMHYFSIFFKNLANHTLIFRAFGRKTQIVGQFWEIFENFWWKFHRKI